MALNSTAACYLWLFSGIDVNNTNDLGETAIFSAVIHRNMETVDLLVQYGCDINSVWQQSTPIYLMLYNKNIDSILNVINKGARISQLPGQHNLLLHTYACALYICRQ